MKMMKVDGVVHGALHTYKYEYVHICTKGLSSVEEPVVPIKVLLDLYQHVDYVDRCSNHH